MSPKIKPKAEISRGGPQSLILFQISVILHILQLKKITDLKKNKDPRNRLIFWTENNKKKFKNNIKIPGSFQKPAMGVVSFLGLSDTINTTETITDTLRVVSI